jgi:Glycosyl hydrolase family 47
MTILVRRRMLFYMLPQAIERHCKTPNGFGAFADVTDVNSHPKDEMESFFLSETLK